MVEYRKHPRHRTLKSGKIIYNRRLTVIDCVIRNLSHGGACLEVDTHFLPDEFDLSIPIDCAKYHCRVAWRTPSRIGVAFEDTGAGRAA
jgi:PilZ domain